MIKSLQEALQDQVSQHVPLSEWIETAQDEKLWNYINLNGTRLPAKSISLTLSNKGN